MGKRSAAYRAKQTAKRRTRKRITRRKINAVAKPSPQLANDQSERIVEEETEFPHGTPQDETGTREREETAPNRDLVSLRADYERLRNLLHVEQRKPRVCIQCKRKKEDEKAKARRKFKERMFAGDTIGSRCLLAALKKRGASEQKLHQLRLGHHNTRK